MRRHLLLCSMMALGAPAAAGPGLLFRSEHPLSRTIEQHLVAGRCDDAVDAASVLARDDQRPRHERDPDSCREPPDYAGIAACLERAGRYAEAIRVYDLWLQDGTLHGCNWVWNGVTAHLEKARLLQRELGQPEQALASLAKVLSAPFARTSFGAPYYDLPAWAARLLAMSDAPGLADQLRGAPERVQCGLAIRLAELPSRAGCEYLAELYADGLPDLAPCRGDRRAGPNAAPRRFDGQSGQQLAELLAGERAEMSRRLDVLAELFRRRTPGAMAALVSALAETTPAEGWRSRADGSLDRERVCDRVLGWLGEIYGDDAPSALDRVLWSGPMHGPPRARDEAIARFRHWWHRGGSALTVPPWREPLPRRRMGVLPSPCQVAAACRPFRGD